MNGTPQIVIAMHQQGQVQLQANIADPIIIYGMLERAKDAIRKNMDDAERQSVIAAPAGALAGLQN